MKKRNEYCLIIFLFCQYVEVKESQQRYSHPFPIRCKELDPWISSIPGSGLPICPVSSLIFQKKYHIQSREDNILSYSNHRITRFLIGKHLYVDNSYQMQTNYCFSYLPKDLKRGHYCWS